MSDMKRVSLSLPKSLVDDLDYICGRLGVSRSGFIASILQQADMPSLRALVSHIPEQPADDDVKRFRGSSQAYFDKQLQRLQQLQGGLFDDSTD